MLTKKELKLIDRNLEKISKKIFSVDIFPINIEEEKEKFFSRKNYNPLFKYKTYSDDEYSSIKEEIRKIRCDNSIIGRIFTETKRSYMLSLRLRKNLGKSKFSFYSKRLYGIPDKKLIKRAKKLVKLKRKKEKKEFTSKEITRKLRAGMIKYGFDWKIKEKDMIASAAVIVEDKTLYIRKNSKFSKRFIKRLIVHEIGTHILRAENGFSQPYKIFSRGLPGYLKTEEGLAVINEERNNALSNSTLRIYAGRVLAIDKALRSSFYETYSYLRKYFSENISWKLTLRAKRGIKDTSMPGAFTKDIAYLKGYYEIKEYLKKNSIIDLYYGKIGLEHIEKVKKIDGIINPVFLPLLRYFKYFSLNIIKIFKLPLKISESIISDVNHISKYFGKYFQKYNK